MSRSIFILLVLVCVVAFSARLPMEQQTWEYATFYQLSRRDADGQLKLLHRWTSFGDENDGDFPTLFCCLLWLEQSETATAKSPSEVVAAIDAGIEKGAIPPGENANLAMVLNAAGKKGWEAYQHDRFSSEEVLATGFVTAIHFKRKK